MNKLLQTLTVTVLLCGFAFAQEEPDTVVNYFPLNVGDWRLFGTYRHIDYFELSDTTFVIDTLDILGNKYWGVGEEKIYSDYYRVDEQGNVLISNEDSTESIIYKFDMAIGDTFYVDSTVYNENYFQTMISKDTTAITPAGEFKNCIMIMTESTESTDSYQYLWFAPNVGIVKVYLLAWDVTGGLVSAKIGTTYYGDIVGVTDEFKSNPTSCSLSDNYPNPFNPITTIDFALPEAIHTSLIIYDLLGKEVVRLVDGEIGAGNHSATWHASGVASGIYFYRLTAGEFVQTRKMVLLK